MSKFTRNREMELGRVHCIFVTNAYAMGTIYVRGLLAWMLAWMLACLFSTILRHTQQYVTLCSTSHNHVRHTREFSTYIGNVSGDKANSYYVRINLACVRTLLRLFEVSFKLFAS